MRFSDDDACINVSRKHIWGDSRSTLSLNQHLDWSCKHLAHLLTFEPPLPIRAPAVNLGGTGTQTETILSHLELLRTSWLLYILSLWALWACMQLCARALERR